MILEENKILKRILKRKLIYTMILSKIDLSLDLKITTISLEVEKYKLVKLRNLITVQDTFLMMLKN
jgi:hypothetical protein